MNADQVRALVAAKFPGVLNSPPAVACASFAAADEADRAVQFASLQARACMDAHVTLYREWYLCTYRSLGRWKQACSFCAFQARCL